MFPGHTRADGDSSSQTYGNCEDFHLSFPSINTFYRFYQIILPPATKLGQGYVSNRVCDFVHRGGVVSQHALQVVSHHALQQISRGRGGIPACLAGLQAHTQGGLQAHTYGVSRPTPRGCIPACTEADPPDGYCCGRYAPYWNAFLFIYRYEQKWALHSSTVSVKTEFSKVSLFFNKFH